MFKKILVGIIFSFVHATGAHAEPSSLVRKLMNSDLSRFEFGIFRLEKDLDRYLNLKHSDTIFGSVAYVWSSNTIAVNMTRVRPRCATSEECAALGRELLQEFVDIYCSTSERSAIQCDEREDLSRIFAPIGFEVPNFHNGRSAADAVIDIKHTVELRAMLLSTGGGFIECVRKYTGRETYCSPRKR
jgi:hypothetical protein